MRDGDRITGGGGSESFGGNLDAYGDVLVGDSLTEFSTTCRDDETETSKWFLIAPGSVTVSTP